MKRLTVVLVSLFALGAWMASPCNAGSAENTSQGCAGSVLHPNLEINWGPQGNKISFTVNTPYEVDNGGITFALDSGQTQWTAVAYLGGLETKGTSNLCPHVMGAFTSEDLAIQEDVCLTSFVHSHSREKWNQIVISGDITPLVFTAAPMQFYEWQDKENPRLTRFQLQWVLTGTLASPADFDVQLNAILSPNHK